MRHFNLTLNALTGLGFRSFQSSRFQSSPRQPSPSNCSHSCSQCMSSQRYLPWTSLNATTIPFECTMWSGGANNGGSDGLTMAMRWCAVDKGVCGTAVRERRGRHPRLHLPVRAHLLHHRGHSHVPERHRTGRASTRCSPLSTTRGSQRSLALPRAPSTRLANTDVNSLAAQTGPRSELLRRDERAGGRMVLG